MSVTPMMQTVSWSLHRLEGDIVFIVDNDDGGMSVTNAAELVCVQCVKFFGDKRIVYCDTAGQWDELVHLHGCFLHFAPSGEEIP